MRPVYKLRVGPRHGDDASCRCAPRMRLGRNRCGRVLRFVNGFLVEQSRRHRSGCQLSLVLAGKPFTVPSLRTISWLDPCGRRLTAEDYRARRTTWVRSIVLHTTVGDEPQIVHAGSGPSGGGRANDRGVGLGRPSRRLAHRDRRRRDGLLCRRPGPRRDGPRAADQRRQHRRRARPDAEARDLAGADRRADRAPRLAHARCPGPGDTGVADPPRSSANSTRRISARHTRSRGSRSAARIAWGCSGTGTSPPIAVAGIPATQ